MEKLRSYLMFYACLFLILGIMILDFARILPSLSMVLLVLLGLSYWIKPIELSEKVDSKPFLVLIISYLILLPSFFYSNNLSYLMEKWQIAIPYLLLPLSFIKIPRLSSRRLFLLYEFYFLGILLICLVAFGYYLLNQEIINQLYLESRVMPTLLSHHPTLSLMIVFAIYVANWLYQKNLYYKLKSERMLFLVGGIFLFIFLHVFSVRSGLLAMYLIIIVELSKLIFQKRQFKTAFLAAVVLFVIGGITLKVSPTVSNKIANTTQDLNNYQNNGSANNQSLGSRIISYKNGIRIAKESSLLWGCGIGDISDLNDAIFKKDYPDVSKIITPHNQFLYYLGAIGIIGVIVFTCSFYFPLFYKKAYFDPLLSTHLLIMSVGFQFEAPLQSQLGVAYSIIFILLPLHQKFGSKALKRV